MDHLLEYEKFHSSFKISTTLNKSKFKTSTNKQIIQTDIQMFKSCWGDKIRLTDKTNMSPRAVGQSSCARLSFNPKPLLRMSYNLLHGGTHVSFLGQSISGFPNKIMKSGQLLSRANFGNGILYSSRDPHFKNLHSCRISNSDPSHIFFRSVHDSRAWRKCLGSASI